MTLGSLLDSGPVVATAGIDLIADALSAQGVDNSPADWRPPLPKTAAALAVLAGARTAEANLLALDRMLSVRPSLVAIAPAGDVIPGLDAGTLLHAGPPIAWPD